MLALNYQEELLGPDEAPFHPQTTASPNHQDREAISPEQQLSRKVATESARPEKLLSGSHIISGSQERMPATRGKMISAPIDQ
jgi:hypothetical protein